MACCSTCGRGVLPPCLPPPRLRVDLGANTASWGETTVRLSARDAEMLKVLLDAAPRTVTPRDFDERLLGYGDEERCGAWLRMRILILRRALRGLPVMIVTVYGRGYRLMEIPPSDDCDPAGDTGVRRVG